uniref:Uncharacterized protein n=1 Tax=Oryza sativa subsp. japonica TaxID=39947 RepID=Q5Z5Z8_ORYSJ|nr:hypothetical protein [Oryza sativa Japonica Group]
MGERWPAVEQGQRRDGRRNSELSGEGEEQRVAWRQERREDWHAEAELLRHSDGLSLGFAVMDDSATMLGGEREHVSLSAAAAAAGHCALVAATVRDSSGLHMGRWLHHGLKKAEDLQFLVEDEQSKVTPTTCSMECPNGSSPSTTARSIYDDEGATPTIILELGDGEGKDRMPFIISKDLSELTPIMCLTICSSLDVEPDFTVAAVVTCSNTAMDSKELVATDGATGTTNIDPRVCSKETHTKCLLFGPDVNGVTDRGVIVFQSRMGVFKVVPISSQSMELMVDEKATCTDTTHLPKVMHPSHLMLGPNVNTGTIQAGVAYSLLLGAPEGIASSGKATLVMAQKLNSNFCLKWVALNRCSTKCSKGYKKLLMSHPKRNPWPPPCSVGVHFGVRRISEIIARGAGENQNRKVKTCSYDSIFDFCENNPSDGSAAARFSIDGIDTRTDSEMIYASIANRDYWSVKLFEVIKEGCPIRHLLLGDVKIEQLLQCETFSTRQTNIEQVIKLQLSNSKEIQELQVPWDPGGFLHRLGDKPNFKKRGLSRTRVGCTWAAGCTTGCGNILHVLHHRLLAGLPISFLSASRASSLKRRSLTLELPPCRSSTVATVDNHDSRARARKREEKVYTKSLISSSDYKIISQPQNQPSGSSRACMQATRRGFQGSFCFEFRLDKVTNLYPLGPMMRQPQRHAACAAVERMRVRGRRLRRRVAVHPVEHQHAEVADWTSAVSRSVDEGSDASCIGADPAGLPAARALRREQGERQLLPAARALRRTWHLRSSSGSRVAVGR